MPIRSLKNPRSGAKFLYFTDSGKSIARDTSEFSRIRANGQIYVDKTAWLHRMITDPCGTLFVLSRPRRFGKSLMISTLEAIFQGRRELFEGLAISRLDYSWEVHPVIHLNMARCTATTYEDYIASLPVEMERALSEAGYRYEPALLPADNLTKAISFFNAHGHDAVLLVDEYDAPVAHTLQNLELAERIRGNLSTIYGRLKDFAGRMRFLMMTGVSKFTKMSIFSTLSNLNDISLDDHYASMLGFTEEELDRYYGEHIAAHAERMRLSLEAYRSELRRMYNGYRFWRFEGENVYNPVSINLTLANQEPMFNCYWADTGRPSILMNTLKRRQMLAMDPEDATVATARDFDVGDMANLPPKGLLYQTGYLTMRNFDPRSGIYTLGVPDEEVRRDLAVLMASLCADQSLQWAASIGVKLLQEDWEHFFEGLKALYAGVAYGPTEKRVCEFSYGRCLAFLLQGQGISCSPEMVQANGRADMVCVHPCGIYIFELKVDKPARIALNQIKVKSYAAPYAADPRPVWLVGLSFDSRTRLLADCAVRQFKKHP